ncbi:hypothetical protein [Microbulbifer sp.]|uniref:hypothetical protein n=1 Tax=Microbulbifer sp. TaxID=1908541 RepID=UPI003F346B06
MPDWAMYIAKVITLVDDVKGLEEDIEDLAKEVVQVSSRVIRVETRLETLLDTLDR